jgi:hypothetical protein
MTDAERQAARERNRQVQARRRARISEAELREQNRRAQAQRRARLPAEEIREQNRQAQARRRARLSSQDADQLRIRHVQEETRHRARIPPEHAAQIQTRNTARHREVYWADWPVDYRAYANDIAAARRLFYAQARAAEGSSALATFKLTLRPRDPPSDWPCRERQGGIRIYESFLSEKRSLRLCLLWCTLRGTAGRPR